MVASSFTPTLKNTGVMENVTGDDDEEEEEEDEGSMAITESGTGSITRRAHLGVNSIDSRHYLDHFSGMFFDLLN